MRNPLTVLIVTALLSAGCDRTHDIDNASVMDAETHRAAVEDWRQGRHDGLKSDDGWLTLVGLEWLQEGPNTVGSGEGNNVRLPGGPEYWGTVHVEQDSLRFVTGDEQITIDGGWQPEAILRSDKEDKPTRVRSGALSFYPIFRESYALRVKDAQSPVLLNFEGIRNYEIRREWRIEGRLVPAAAGTTIEIINVQGQVEDQPIVGTFQFEMGGQPYELLVQQTGDPPRPWIIFSDRTNSKETYGAGRYVYVDEITEDNRIVVDFNKAYNPPCAFTDYATCPIPPQVNRLDLAVTAGEKDFH